MSTVRQLVTWAVLFCGVAWPASSNPDSDDDGLPDASEPGRNSGFEDRRTVASEGAHVIAVDLDGDDDLDLVLSENHQLGWRANTDGMGTFGAFQPIATDFDATDIHARDVDGDAHTDVVALGDDLPLGASNLRIAWFRNIGSAVAFEARPLVDTLPIFEWRAFVALVVDDLDDDGDVDIATSFDPRFAGPGEVGGVIWYENVDGTGQFGSRTQIASDGFLPRGGVGDFDGDGRPDVFLYFGQIVFGDADASSGFSEPVPVDTLGPLGEGAFGYEVHVADVDGDGDLDIVSGDRYRRWHENQDGQGLSWRHHVFGNVAASGRFDSADFDGDGDLDLVFVGWNLLSWHENLDGRGVFGGPRAIALLEESVDDGAVVAADIDGDGDADVVMSDETDQGRYGTEPVSWSPRTGLDPLDPDGDGDGLCDGDGETVSCPIGGEDTNGNGVYDPGVETDPNSADTDGDGVSDGIERIWDSDPLDPADVPDDDGDGVLDPADNCVNHSNAPTSAGGFQLDTDRDGLGNACDPDFDQSGHVDGLDFDFYVAAFNSSGSVTDLNGDGSTDGLDFNIYVDFFNRTPGPSALPCADAQRPTGAGVVPCQMPSAYAVDADGDGVSDGHEIEDGTDPGSAESFVDADGDLVPDRIDNCVLLANGPNELANQLDGDLDGFGNRCDGDLDNNGVADGADFDVLLPLFGQPGTPGDFNGDGFVGPTDIFILPDEFFNLPPGPSGLDCAGNVVCQHVPIR